MVDPENSGSFSDQNGELFLLDTQLDNIFFLLEERIESQILVMFPEEVAVLQRGDAVIYFIFGESHKTSLGVSTVDLALCNDHVVSGHHPLTQDLQVTAFSPIVVEKTFRFVLPFPLVFPELEIRQNSPIEHMVAVENSSWRVHPCQNHQMIVI